MLLLFVVLGSSAVQAQRPQTREGFWISFGFGGGSAGISCDFCGNADRESGATGHIRLGGTVSPKLLVGGEVNAWTKEEGGETVTLGNVSAVAYYYPAPAGGFFLKGGLGFSTIELEDSTGSSATGTGVGLVLGGGYDIRLARKFSLTPQINWFFGSIGEIEGVDVGWKQNVFEFALGFTFH